MKLSIQQVESTINKQLESLELSWEAAKENKNQKLVDQINATGFELRVLLGNLQALAV